MSRANRLTMKLLVSLRQFAGGHLIQRVDLFGDVAGHA
jgi:hypothetical protein